MQVQYRAQYPWLLGCPAHSISVTTGQCAEFPCALYKMSPLVVTNRVNANAEASDNFSDLQ